MIVRDVTPETAEPWTDPVNPTQERLEQLRAALVGTSDLDSIPDPEPLIDGVLTLDSLAWLYGKPGSGKSFLALDWAGCVAGGLPWNLREVTRGPVLYLVAEGSRGIRRRVRAWEQMTGQPMAGVLFLPIAVQLLHGTDRAALVHLVTELQPALVVIDTQARVTVGAEENSNAEMGRVVAAADEIREASGACVLMVHHTGRQGGNMRGASAFDGAASAVIRVNRDGDWLDVISEKQKDDEDFPPMRLRMERTGNSITLTATASAGPAAMTEGQAEILTELRQSFGSDGASASVLLKTTGASERTFYRDLKSLVSRGAVHKGGTEARPRYYLPEYAPGRSLPSLPTTATAVPH